MVLRVRVRVRLRVAVEGQLSPIAAITITINQLSRFAVRIQAICLNLGPEVDVGRINPEIIPANLLRGLAPNASATEEDHMRVVNSACGTNSHTQKYVAASRIGGSMVQVRVRKTTDYRRSSRDFRVYMMRTHQLSQIASQVDSCQACPQNDPQNYPETTRCTRMRIRASWASGDEE